MPRLFVDTSAIVKLYKTEPNSADVRAVVPSSAEILISATLPLEFRSAFAVLERMRILTAGEASIFVSTFLSHRTAYVEVAISGSTLALAESLVERYGVSNGLRPLDAIQIAGAIMANALEPVDAIVSTDNALRSVAAAEGLTVLPP